MSVNNLNLHVLTRTGLQISGYWYMHRQDRDCFAGESAKEETHLQLLLQVVLKPDQSQT
jgi:hypothetical protein